MEQQEFCGDTSIAYSDFTFREAVKRFELTVIEQEDLFAPVAERVVSEFLRVTLAENVPLALVIQTEKARSELIIAPILVELRRILDRRISLFLGIDFTVDVAQGINGVCDYGNPIQVVKVARWLKPRAMRDEGRLRGLAKPAKAGFVNVAGGFSLPASQPG